MAYLELDKIQAGMVLTSDLKTSAGHLLLPAGTEITTRHLDLLKDTGVTGAHVAFKTATISVQPSTTALKHNMIARELFRHNDLDHPFIQELIRLCQYRIASAIGEDHEH